MNPTRSSTRPSARPMRITFVLDHAGLSGGLRVIAGYAARLSQRGHRVFVVSRPRHVPGVARRARALMRGRIVRGQPEPRESLLAGTGAEHHVIERRRLVVDSDVPDADVVIATWWETAEWVHALAPEKGRKAFFLQHYEAHEHQPVGRVRAAWRLPLRKIVIAEWLRDMAERDFDDPTAILVPNAIDTDHFDAPPRGRRGTPTVGVMYSRARFKGCDVALEAVRLAQRRRPGLKLLAFGHERPDRSLPLPPGAVFHHQPPQSRIPGLYASCDAWLFASRSEGYGLPALEAMACRTPVIGTPAGAAPELIGEGGGTLVPMDDPGAMGVAICDLLSAPERQWKEMSDAAYASARARRWDRSTDLFEGALRSIAGAPAAPLEVRQSA